MDATVGDELQTVVGHLRLDPDADLQLVDALARLPTPTDDLQARRTWPEGTETGHVWWQADPPTTDALDFHAILPRRYDASGTVPGRGLFADGLWVPQPVRNGVPAVVDWDVTVHLPRGAVGVLNGTVGQGSLHWTGRADRLALAVLPHGHITRLPLPVGELVVLETGPRRPAWERELGRLFSEAWPGASATQLVVVETPAYRHLYRAGPDTLFLAERALRLSGPLARLHAPAVRRGMLEASLPIPDPWDRALAADAIAGTSKDKGDLRKSLGWWSWLPQIDAILYDGDLPYYADVFDEANPDDPLADDLSDLLAPAAPARSVARKIDAKYGGGTARAMAFRLIQGDDRETAARSVGIDTRDLAAWRTPNPDQDLHLKVAAPKTADGPWQVTVRRDAPPTAAPELVPVSIDQQVQLWETGPGADSKTWSWPVKPSTVALDPDGLDRQRSTSGDRWPARWATTVSAWVNELDLRSGRISGYADIETRRQYNTRWLYGLDLETNPENLASLSAYVVFFAGPLQNLRDRPVHIGLSVGPSILDPNYQSTAGAAWTLDTQLWASIDTRDDPYLPRHGGRIGISGGAGWAPGGALPWGSAGAGAAGLLPLGGRVVLGGAVGGSLARTDLAHRKLDLGLDGLAPGLALGERRTGANAELRWQILRNRSVPAEIAWLSDLELTGGGEAATLGEGVQTWTAAGWTAGLNTVWDLLGAEPVLISLQAAEDLWANPASLIEGAGPRFYLRFGQRF